MAKETAEEAAFGRQLESVIKKTLKPDFDQVESRFNNVDNRFNEVDKKLANLESSNRDIHGKLAQILSKLG